MLKLLTSWNEVKEKIKESNVNLTDEDLNYLHGEEEKLLQRLSKKMNRSPVEIKVWIESISSNRSKAS